MGCRNARMIYSFVHFLYRKKIFSLKSLLSSFIMSTFSLSDKHNPKKTNNNV